MIGFGLKSSSRPSLNEILKQVYDAASQKDTIVLKSHLGKIFDLFIMISAEDRFDVMTRLVEFPDVAAMVDSMDPGLSLIPAVMNQDFKMLELLLSQEKNGQPRFPALVQTFKVMPLILQYRSIWALNKFQENVKLQENAKRLITELEKALDFILPKVLISLVKEYSEVDVSINLMDCPKHSDQEMQQSVNNFLSRFDKQKEKPSSSVEPPAPETPVPAVELPSAPAPQNSRRKRRRLRGK